MTTRQLSLRGRHYLRSIWGTSSRNTSANLGPHTLTTEETTSQGSSRRSLAFDRSFSNPDRRTTYTSRRSARSADWFNDLSRYIIQDLKPRNIQFMAPPPLTEGIAFGRSGQDTWDHRAAEDGCTQDKDTFS
ncbi:hypothetical protein VTL71DRAFT_14947, partial [Oculimacula yallundae]